MDTTTNIRISKIEKDFIEIIINEKEVFTLDFKRYPYFKYCTIEEILNVQCDGFDVSWPNAVIDLQLDLLRHPKKVTSMASLEGWKKVRDMVLAKKALSDFAKQGGSKKTEAKATSSRLNGAKGGRPRLKNISKIAMF